MRIEIDINGKITEHEDIVVVQEEKTVEQMVAHFEALTNNLIQSKVEEWNEANKASGTKFDSIASFPKYAVIPTDSRHDISVQFLTWNGKLWDALRDWQKTLTEIPTDADWQEVVNGVVF